MILDISDEQLARVLYIHLCNQVSDINREMEKEFNTLVISVPYIGRLIERIEAMKADYLLLKSLRKDDQAIKGDCFFRSLTEKLS